MAPQNGAWSASSDGTEPHGALRVQLVLYVRGSCRGGGCDPSAVSPWLSFAKKNERVAHHETKCLVGTLLGNSTTDRPGVDRTSAVTPYTWAEKFESFKRINSIRETNGNFDSCNSCKRLVPSRLHELHESKFPFVSRIKFIRSKLSNFSAHVYGVYVPFSLWLPAEVELYFALGGSEPSK